MTDLLFRSQAALEERRRRFEDEDTNRCREQARARLRQMIDEQPRSLKDKFFHFLRGTADGSIRLAWRRYFDSDGDGELTFREFANALLNLRYQGDIVILWHELGGNESKILTMYDMDPEGAAILDYVSKWCTRKLGGPIEVFTAIDDGGSENLTADEFMDGLTKLGFFDAVDVPESISTVELARENLFSILDQDGQGAISPDEILFLEQDKEKRERMRRELERISKYGREGAQQPLPRDAERLLRNSRWSYDMWNESLPAQRLNRPVSAPSLGPPSPVRSAPVSPHNYHPTGSPPRKAVQRLLVSQGLRKPTAQEKLQPSSNDRNTKRVRKSLLTSVSQLNSVYKMSDAAVRERQQRPDQTWLALPVLQMK